MNEIVNPYNPATLDANDKHYVAARVSAEDFLYIKTHYPMLVGMADKLEGTLFKTLIDQLKDYERIAGKLEPAWTVGHPTYGVLVDILSRLQRCSVGSTLGNERARDVAGAADSVHQTVCSAEEQRSDKEGGSGQGGRQEESTSKEGQRGAGDGVAGSAGQEMTGSNILFNQLNRAGVKL